MRDLEEVLDRLSAVGRPRYWGRIVKTESEPYRYQILVSDRSFGASEVWKVLTDAVEKRALSVEEAAKGVAEWILYVYGPEISVEITVDGKRMSL